MGDPQYAQLSCPKTANDPTVFNPLQEEHGQKGGRWAVAVDCVKIIHQKRHVLCRQMSAANVELQNCYIMLDHCKLPSVRMSANRFHLFTFSTYPLGTMVNQSANSGASLWSILNPSYFLVSVCMNSCDQVFKDQPDVNPHPWPDNYNNACSPCRLPESVMKEAEACNSLLIPCT